LNYFRPKDCRITISSNLKIDIDNFIYFNYFSLAPSDTPFVKVKNNNLNLWYKKNTQMCLSLSFEDGKGLSEVQFDGKKYCLVSFSE
jgi:hypothetical protein